MLDLGNSEVPQRTTRMVGCCPVLAEGDATPRTLLPFFSAGRTPAASATSLSRAARENALPSRDLRRFGSVGDFGLPGIAPPAARPPRPRPGARLGRLDAGRWRAGCACFLGDCARLWDCGAAAESPLLACAYLGGDPVLEVGLTVTEKLASLPTSRRLTGRETRAAAGLGDAARNGERGRDGAAADDSFSRRGPAGLTPKEPLKASNAARAPSPLLLPRDAARRWMCGSSAPRAAAACADLRAAAAAAEGEVVGGASGCLPTRSPESNPPLRAS